MILTMIPIEQLKKLDHESKTKKYPSVPAHAIPRAKHNDTTANGITRAVLSWLELKGHYATRIQSQGQYQPKLKRWTKSTVKRGVGDISAVINGRSIMIEVKAGRDRQSEWQKQTQEQVEASGGVYLLVRSFDDFHKWYVEFIADHTRGT